MIIMIMLCVLGIIVAGVYVAFAPDLAAHTGHSTHSVHHCTATHSPLQGPLL